MKYNLALAALLAVASSNAALITVSYADAASVGSGTAGNIITKTSGVFTVEAQAYAVNSGAGTPSFVDARLRDYGTPGLGVCNASENSDGNCSTSGDPTEHQLDNSGYKDFAGFRFSSGGSLLAVTNISIVVNSLASDWDGSYWLGNTTNAFDLTGTSVANLGANGFQARVDVSNPAASGGVATFTIGNITAYNTIIFGTKYTNDNDGFKIKSLSFEATDPRLPPNEVPEPATYALLGAALVGLGVARRKRS